MGTHYEKQIESARIFDGKIISVTLDTVELENGNTSMREIVHHNGGACVIAINSKKEIALVKQFRYAMGKEMLELPAGKIEPGEDPMQTAIRELKEEAGCIAEIVLPFGDIIPTCAYCTETIYIYYATGLTCTTQQLDEDEFVDITWVPLEKAIELVLNGELNDGKSSFAILKAYYLLQNNTIEIK